MYVQQSPFAETREGKDLYELAETIAANVNNSIPGGLGLSLIFDGHSFVTKQYPEFDDYSSHTEILSKVINEILILDKQYEHKDDYLSNLLKFIKDNILNNYDKVVVKEMFNSFYLIDFYDEISAKFLRDKLKSYVTNL